MSDLRLPMNELAFDQLVTLGRSVIPSTTRGWTDHNVHDPGIMLMELMAWIAEAQMYSLGRVRKDERLAYARLLDVRPQGPTPACGLIWPFSKEEPEAPTVPPWSEGRGVAAASRVTADRPLAPAFFTTDAVALTTAHLVKLETIFADGRQSQDWTAVNIRDGATFQPFGVAPAKGDRLSLTFTLEEDHLEDFAGPLSIGFEIVNTAELPVRAAALHRRHRLLATVDEKDETRALRITKDTTNGLLRSGVVLVDFGDAPPTSPTFTISIASGTGGFVRSPRVQRVAPNVLSIEQRESIAAEYDKLRPNEPDQTYRLRREGLMFPEAADAVQVQVAENGTLRTWHIVPSFDMSGPSDRDVRVDYATSTLTFGNGINGFIPTRESDISVRYNVCSGTAGNLPSGLQWQVDGITGAFGVNSQPIVGGLDARGLRELQTIVQERTRRARPIVTTRDLEEAARSFVDLGVNRAVEMPATADSRAPRGTRTLIVLSGRERQADVQPAAEAGEFLEEVRYRLAARLPVGQRLEVMGPRYVPVRVRATIGVGVKVDPAGVRSKVLEILRTNLSVVAAEGRGGWPFGRDVTALSIKGWLRKVEGVERVEQVQLLRGEEEESIDPLRLGPRDLPLLRIAVEDIDVRRPSPKAPAGPGTQP